MYDHLKGRESEVILPQMAIEMLHELSKAEALITTGVGQRQMWTGQFYKFKYPRQFLTIAGLGAMGRGYPAALGVKVAFPDRQVVDIDGDGSFLMNIQELATAHIEKIEKRVSQRLELCASWGSPLLATNRVAWVTAYRVVQGRRVLHLGAAPGLVPPVPPNLTEENEELRCLCGLPFRTSDFRLRPGRRSLAGDTPDTRRTRAVASP